MSDPQQPPWTAASQAPPSMGFSRQEYWSGVPLPSLNYLNNLVQKHLLWLRIPGVVIKRIKTLIAVLIHERKSDFILGGNPFLLGSFPGGSVVKNPLNNAGDTGDSGLIPGPGSSPGGGNGNSLQYSCLKNPMDRRAWWATVHGVAKSWIWLNMHAQAGLCFEQCLC